MRKARAVRTGGIANRFTLVSESAWRDIEEQSSYRIDDKSKTAINHLMAQYATKGPTANRTITPRVLGNTIGKWDVRTDLVCAQVDRSQKRSIRAKDYVPNKLHLRSAELAHARLCKIGVSFLKSARQQSSSLVATDLAQFLRDTTVLVDAMAVYIGRHAPKPPSRMQWWLVWITLIILQLRKNGNSVSWRKGKKKGVRRGFVHFIVLLHKHLPPRCVPRKSYQSVQKGIVRSIRLTTDKPVTELKAILTRWGNGEFDLASKAQVIGMRDPRMFALAKMLRRVENAARASGI